MEPLVSIIVPIYKVEPFVEVCVRSLILQKHQNIEIILVDDGSPDRCGAIIDAYRDQDLRIHVIHKANGGVSAARNDGLAIASGDYIMFVDGDDYVEPDYVSYFIALLENNRCDMAISTRFFHKEGQRQDPEEPYVADANRIMEQIYLNRIGVAVWNKIYRRSVLVENGLAFDTKFWFAEGMLFNIVYLQHVDRIAVGQRRVYHFAENLESATRKFNLNSYLCGLRSMELQKERWKAPTQEVQMAWEYHYRRYAEVIMEGLIRDNLVEKHRDIYAACKTALKKNLRIPLQVDQSAWGKTHAVCLSIDPELVLGQTQKSGRHLRFSEKHRLFLIKVVNKLPLGLKQAFFRVIACWYRKHYRPVYLGKKLL